MNKHIPLGRRVKVLWKILRYTNADKMLLSFIIFVFVDALLIFIFDPAITTYGDALWYCYAVISTAGFGDVVATTFIAKLCSVLLTVYAVLVIAIITGVIVNFYTKLIEMKREAEKKQTPESEDRHGPRQEAL